MKNRKKELIESVLKEMDSNDPVLVLLRAKKDQDSLKGIVPKTKAPKGRVYGKQRQEIESKIWKLENDIFDLKRDLKDLQVQKNYMMIDMENEAGQLQSKGKEIDDKFGNEWGEKLNKIDEEIKNLYVEIKKIQDKILPLEIKLNL